MHETQKQRGFTFVETLVAVSILLMAVTAPLSLGSQGLTASRIARDQVIATYLAQEAIEYVRNLRDTNILQGNDWLTGLDACITDPCAIDVPSDDIIQCDDVDGCEPLRFDEETGLYSMSSAGGLVDTKYVRSLTITISDDNQLEARLVALVVWQDGTNERSVSIEETIFDWQ